MVSVDNWTFFLWNGVHDPVWWWAQASNLWGLNGPVVRFNLAHVIVRRSSSCGFPCCSIFFYFKCVRLTSVCDFNGDYPSPFGMVCMILSGDGRRLQTCGGLTAQLFDSTLRTLLYGGVPLVAFLAVPFFLFQVCTVDFCLWFQWRLSFSFWNGVHDPVWWWAQASNLWGLNGPVVRFNLAHVIVRRSSSCGFPCCSIFSISFKIRVLNVLRHYADHPFHV